MTTPGSDAAEHPPRILARPYALTTIGTFTLVFFSAFEALAVTTVMPGVARELHGVRLFALSFAAPLASGVVGMVTTGWWSDRRGAARPLITSIALFGLGLLVCGLAPTMPALVAGRLLQGLGGGGLTVGLYVVVGQVYPSRLQPSLFASFAAAWVLPSLIGPTIAAFVAEVAGWRWVFLGVVALVAGAALLIVPALRSLPPIEPGDEDGSGPRRLAWAMVAAVAVLGLDLAGETPHIGWLISAAAAVVVLVAIGPLMPPGTLRSRVGLPSVIATRGALSAGFLSTESYLPFVLQDRWGWSPGAAGAALAAAGLTWALASQGQARLRDRLSNTAAMVGGATVLLVGAAGALLLVRLHGPALGLVVCYGVTAAGMGASYPRTTVATLAVSTDVDRGFNSAALSIADSLGGALALAICGVAFAATQRGNPFVVVYVVAVAWAVVAVLASRRTASA